LIQKQPVNKISIEANEITLKSSPMKFKLPGKLILARIKINKNVENTG